LDDKYDGGCFVEADGETWYRIDRYDQRAPFFIALAGDSDLWAFVSTAGSLTAGRKDRNGAYLPYETVDKIHVRWEHTGPRTWIRFDSAGPQLWEPFAQRPGIVKGPRSLWKNLSGTRLRFRETHASGRLVFQYEWSFAAGLGLVRTSRLEAPQGPMTVEVLDGVLNLLAPGISFEQSATLSCLTDAYKWNETSAGGRLALYTLYAQIWDRAEPKESFQALTAWHSGLPASTRMLLSAHQVERFCRTGEVESEALTRGRRGAALVQFSRCVDRDGSEWFLVVNGPCSQVEAFELSARLQAGGGTPGEIRAAIEQNSRGLEQLLACADGFQSSADPMAAAHHRANVLFNIMRGGVFVDRAAFSTKDLLAFVRGRNHKFGSAMEKLAAGWGDTVERGTALAAAGAVIGVQAERLVREYLPLTFSRRHGDPSRPWNLFSVHVRDAAGQRVMNYEGNWRDIFQNWEGLLPSAPEYAGSMVSIFLCAMSPDGYNPYRISRNGIDWEVENPDDPWSHIGYWGDHQIVYLLRLLEAAHARDPELLPADWDRPIFSFADIPYRLRAYAQQVAHPKATIVFDEAADARARSRASQLGADGLLVCDEDGDPILATLGEKLAIILLAKAGTLVPGGGLWLHTQRPEWNDANNALVGNGLSLVTLAHLRRLLAFIVALPCAGRSFSLSQATLVALQALAQLVRKTPVDACDHPAARRSFLDACGAILDPWRAAAYCGAAGRVSARAPQDLLVELARDLMPIVDATLHRAKRPDGLYHSYNLVDLSGGQADVTHLYPMLEGQVAMLGSGLLSPSECIALLKALYASALYASDRNTFLLYPDRRLPGFLERNRLDARALDLPVVRQLLAQGRTDLLQRQSDGTVRFAPELANRDDLERIGADVADLQPLANAYDRLLGHHEFTGRSGTMFAYEGLGCVYWHMVAKLLLAVQEQVFAAYDLGAPELGALCQYYRRVRDGLGYRKSAARYGAFPADPYSHTTAEGGAQQPGMTGQVKEEILTRWGELGLRVRAGRVHFDPVLLDESELAEGRALTFTWARVPYSYRLGTRTAIRILTATGWLECPQRTFDPLQALRVEAEICAGRDPTG